jgi:hypothetical protein
MSLTATVADISGSYMEPGINTTGDISKAKRTTSPVTKQRMAAERSIRKIAKQNGTTVDDVVTKLLAQSGADLARYVQAKGETPRSDAKGLAIQAILLRANEVATVAKAMDTDDEDALSFIEKAESEAMTINSADTAAIFPPDVDAAVKICLDYLSAMHAKISTGKMQDFIAQAKAASGVDSFDFNTRDFANFQPIGSPSLGGSRLGNVSKPDRFDPDNFWGRSRYNNSDSGSGDMSIGELDDLGGSFSLDSSYGTDYNTDDAQSGDVSYINPSIGTGSNAQISSSQAASLPSTPSTTSTNNNSLFNTIGSIVGAIGSVAGKVVSTSSALSNTASDIGAQSITKSIQQNWPTILAAIIVIVLIIAIVVYVASHKGK